MYSQRSVNMKCTYSQVAMVTAGTIVGNTILIKTLIILKKHFLVDLINGSTFQVSRTLFIKVYTVDINVRLEVACTMCRTYSEKLVLGKILNIFSSTIKIVEVTYEDIKEVTPIWNAPRALAHLTHEV